MSERTPSTDDPPASDPVRAAAAAPGRTVAGHLVTLTVSLVLPVLLFAAFLLWQYAASERSHLEGEAHDLARTVTLAIDREMTGIFASLDVLTASSRLAAGDFSGFRRQAATILERQGISTIVTDMSGRQLVNLRLPEGAALPASALTLDTKALASGRPFVTDLLTGQVTGTKQFLAVTGVIRDGRPVYALMFSLPTSRLQRILNEAEIDPHYTASIVDRSGLIMARNLRPEEFVGRSATADLLESATGQRGSWSGTTLDGAHVFGAYSRSALTGFRTAVGIRYSDLNAPVRRSLILFLALGVALTGLSVALGLFFGRRISSPIGRLARQAAALGRGEPVPALATRLREANQVGAELARASASLRDRESDLREANEEIQRFAYIVSHDLRSPLVNIMGFTTELEALRGDIFARIVELRGALAATQIRATGGGQEDELGRDFDEAIGFIKASIAKMDRLIQAILQLSREGRRSFHPGRVDMDGLIGTITASLAHQAEEARATITVSHLPALVSDRLALEQIFSNLLDNALKYLRRDVPGRIEVTGRTNPASVVYEVSDNGRGIDPKDRDRVFDLFRRSGAQDRPGEGIGLAHVRALVRRLGGSIGLTSEPGQGSVFTVTLPRRWMGERQREAA